MSQFKTYRVAILPATFNPNSLYFVRSATADLMDIYMSNEDGSSVRHIININEINALISTAVNASVADNTSIKAVDTIAQRNLLVLPKNGFVLVRNATADTTVKAGGALYFYDTDMVLAATATSTITNADRYSKIAEYEGLDVTPMWDALVGKPQSSSADLDDAVARKHSHSNLPQLELITQRADGAFLYKGELVTAKALEFVTDE
jgi:hypothetical protein